MKTNKSVQFWFDGHKLSENLLSIFKQAQVAYFSCLAWSCSVEQNGISFGGGRCGHQRSNDKTSALDRYVLHCSDKRWIINCIYLYKTLRQNSKNDRKQDILALFWMLCMYDRQKAKLRSSARQEISKIWGKIQRFGKADLESTCIYIQIYGRLQYSWASGLASVQSSTAKASLLHIVGVLLQRRGSYSLFALHINRSTKGKRQHCPSRLLMSGLP